MLDHPASFANGDHGSHEHHKTVSAVPKTILGQEKPGAMAMPAAQPTISTPLAPSTKPCDDPAGNIPGQVLENIFEANV